MFGRMIGWPVEKCFGTDRAEASKALAATGDV
jgi:hypothetical protein